MLMRHRLNAAQSLYLDILRALAAQMVLIGHCLDFYWTDLPDWLQVYRMQEFGVVIFFVLSGYLVAFSSDRQQSSGNAKFTDYLQSRAVRIYSTLIPALLLIALLDVLFTHQFAADFPIDYSLTVGLANLLQLQEYPGTGWPFFGSGYPLWSLSVEWWLYMAFGVCMFRDAWRRWYGLPLLLLALGSVLYNAVSGNAPGIVFAWLLGAVAYWLDKPGPRSGHTKILIALAIAAAAIGWIFTSQMNLTPAYHPLAMLVAVLLVWLGLRWLHASPVDTINPFLAVIIRRAAHSSFTLYLIHFSILASLYPLYGHLADGWIIVLAVTAANLLAVVFAKWFEWHWNPKRGLYQGGT